MAKWASATVACCGKGSLALLRTMRSCNGVSTVCAGASGSTSLRVRKQSSRQATGLASPYPDKPAVVLVPAVGFGLLRSTLARIEALHR